MTRSAVATAALAVGLVAGCASGVHVDSTMLTPPPATAGETPGSKTQAPTSSAQAPSSSPRPSAHPTPTPNATPATTPTPSVEWTELQPSAVIDVADSYGYLPSATDGDTIWVGAKGVLLKINARTNAVTKLDAPVMPDDTTLALADEGLWAARWSQDKLYLLDPKTGDVLLDTELEKPVSIAFMGDDMWIGNEAKRSKFKVDRSTGVIDPDSEVPDAAYAGPGEGDFWYVPRGSNNIVRVDPDTKEVKATIDFPGLSNCSVGGTFPDSVWTGCFEREASEQTVARIDPATNSVAQLVKLPRTHGGSVTTIGDQTWFFGAFDGSDGPFGGLVGIDVAKSATDRYLSIAGVDPDGMFVAGGALWVVDEGGHRLLKFDLADLQ